MSGKLEGYEFYRKVLGGPTRVVAPMVDQSELAWRMLSRKYDAQLCYTPMFHSSVFVNDQHYRNEALASCSEDRPLIIQFCGNDAETIVKAGKLAQGHCDAIDINLGCPQMIAKRGYYGAFLENNWPLIEEIVKKCNSELDVPVTCKIRVFEDVEKSVKYARMIEKAGCQLLTVHGRTKEMKGPNTGLASWKHIKAVKEAVSIPVFANGNIQYKHDYIRCMEETGVDGVMIAEGSLRNPCLFTGDNPTVWDISLEYITAYVARYPCPTSYVRGHVFKMCHHALQRHQAVRRQVAEAKNVAEIETAMRELKRVCESECRNNKDKPTENLPLPHWLCQPYIRPPPVQQQPQKVEPEKAAVAESEAAPISKKRLKKLLKRKLIADDKDVPIAERLSKFEADKAAKKVVYSKCVGCGNPAGGRCVFVSCKTCCKKRCKQVDHSLVCHVHSNKRAKA